MEAERKGPSALWHAVVMSGMIISGTINTVAKSIQNDTPSPGWNSLPHNFDHPWFQTLLMFIGELLCFFVFLYFRFFKYAKRREDNSYGKSSTSIQQNDGGTMEGDEYVKNPLFSLLFLPATLFDLTATTLGGIGLLYVPASVWQMMRGSVIIFSGIFSVIFLKRRLRPFHWLGMAITAVGLIIVGVAGMLAQNLEQKEDDSDTDTNRNFIIGVVLILAGQVASAAQMVYEEKYLKSRNYAPLQVVGTEGLFGVILMVFLVLPICWFIPGHQNGHYDDTTDAIIQIMNSNILIIMSVVYIMSIAFYNFFGLTVAKVLTTVHRTLLDAVRIIFVWGVDLIIYYSGLHRYGEQWTKWSYLELGGFVVLLVGSFTYYKVIRWPGLDYEDTVDETAKLLKEEEKK